MIGINTMVRSNTEAIGFAIPINRAREAFDVLKEGKKPTHAYFGMELHGLTPDNARIHNDDPNSQRLPISHGALVTRVMPGSPAASVFRKFDVITEINGQLVRNVAEADFHLDRARIGSACSIKVLRGEMGSKLELSVIPLDLMTLIEEKKSKRMMAFMRPQ